MITTGGFGTFRRRGALNGPRGRQKKTQDEKPILVFCSGGPRVHAVRNRSVGWLGLTQENTVTLRGGCTHAATRAHCAETDIFRKGMGLFFQGQAKRVSACTVTPWTQLCPRRHGPEGTHGREAEPVCGPGPPPPRGPRGGRRRDRGPAFKHRTTPGPHGGLREDTGASRYTTRE